MTGPSQPAMSENVQKARQRLLRLGLTDEHVLSLGPVTTRSFDPSHLQHASSDPHFGAMVQRVLRFLRGGRGLSIAVTDDGQTGEARIHTALQLATGLSRQGIQVVVVDMDFMHPGLGGLVEDAHTEGLIDMVRFGRSCRSLLYKPVAEGASVLACGSFPVLEPMPLDEDAVRSVLHRVSLHCELALYVAPLQPDGQELNPVVRLCEHVVLVHSVSPSSVDIVERIQLMQQARLHVAGVV
jgi:Mrp family chromosome partitioning ATPase